MAQRLPLFILTVKHDRGTCRIHTHASSAPAAKHIVMKAERCPERAIRHIACVDDDFYELVLTDPARRVLLPIPATAVKVTRCPKGNSTVLPTVHMVRTIDQRWRRVFNAKLDGQIVRFVWHGDVRTLVQLPE